MEPGNISHCPLALGNYLGSNSELLLHKMYKFCIHTINQYKMVTVYRETLEGGNIGRFGKITINVPKFLQPKYFV